MNVNAEIAAVLREAVQQIEKSHWFGKGQSPVPGAGTENVCAHWALDRASVSLYQQGTISENRTEDAALTFLASLQEDYPGSYSIVSWNDGKVLGGEAEVKKRLLALADVVEVR